MKYLIFVTLLATGCTNLNRKPFKIANPQDRFEDCVKKFLIVGVSPKESLEICKEANMAEKNKQ